MLSGDTLIFSLRTKAIYSEVIQFENQIIFGWPLFSNVMLTVCPTLSMGNINTYQNLLKAQIKDPIS